MRFIIGRKREDDMHLLRVIISSYWNSNTVHEALRMDIFPKEVSLKHGRFSDFSTMASLQYHVPVNHEPESVDMIDWIAENGNGNWTFSMNWGNKFELVNVPVMKTIFSFDDKDTAIMFKLKFG